MDAEEYDSDLDDINGDDPPKRRIRKRTSTVTMACNQCREKVRAICCISTEIQEFRQHFVPLVASKMRWRPTSVWKMHTT
jgi:hypothetical protein